MRTVAGDTNARPPFRGRLQEKVKYAMQTGAGSSDVLIGPGMLDRIADVLSRIIGVPCVVERFLGNDSTISNAATCEKWKQGR